jgi:hypothetical protein
MVLIREILESDAAGFLDLCIKLDAETQFMMLEPGERLTTVEEQCDRISRLRSQYNQAIFVAENDSQLVGYLTPAPLTAQT